MGKKNQFVQIFVLVTSSAFIGACATPTPTLDMSPEAEVTFDGLHPILGGTAAAAWARPDADISQYSKIMLQGVGIEYRPGGETGRMYHISSSDDHFEITDDQKAKLVEIVQEAFLKELAKSEYFTIVNEAGPDVLLIRGGLLDVVSFVPPDPVGGGEIFLSRVGEATLVLEIRDSTSNAIIARAVDRRAAEDAARGFSSSNRVFNTAQIRRMASTWARRLRERLDSLHTPAE